MLYEILLRPITKNNNIIY